MLDATHTAAVSTAWSATSRQCASASGRAGLGEEPGGELVHLHGAELARVAGADPDRVGSRPPSGRRRACRGSAKAGVADLGAELVAREVGVDAQALGPQALDHLAGVGVALFADGQHDGLPRGEPGGEVPPAVLEVDAEEALERPEDGAVEHDGAVVLAVLADVREVEALGQVGVVLDGAELPGALERVLDVELDLRPVERALAGRDLELRARALEAFGERPLGAVPLLVGADALVGAARRQLDVDLLEARTPVDAVEEAR